ncbi:hypothetical protein [Lignipirellula cremea]|uniref:hypothetical protein n=1 Tax=Lignipirellula cremea TaxID=2528010 RepID=UPI0011A71F60|nr:hypothetical protein [Lignipirellula cremea]
MIALVAALSPAVIADERPQWTVTLQKDKVSIQVDGVTPSQCITATISALNALGYDECTLSLVDASQQSLSETGVVFIAIAEKDTVAIGAPRPVPAKMLDSFLKHFKENSNKRVTFQPSHRQAPEASGGPADAADSR